MAKINSQRLSRYITSRECEKARNVMLDIYECLSVAQRLEIKLMLNRNAKSNNNR